MRNPMDAGNCRRRRWGDRKDGYLVRDIDGIHKIMPHIMPNRTEAETYAEFELDITETMEFLKKRKSGEPPDSRTKFFHCFLMSAAKTLRHRPLMNRFVCGRRTYEHRDIKLGFTSKKKFTDESKDFLTVITVEDDWTLSKITDVVTDSVSGSRKNGSSGSGAVDRCARLPRCILMAMAKFLRFLNFYGWIPSSISDGDVSFTSALLSNLGSINGPPAYHHLNNYGTNSVVVTIGTISEKTDADGHTRQYVKIGVTIDERIADGLYFVRSMKYLQYLLDNPELLDRPLAETVDIDG